MRWANVDNVATCSMSVKTDQGYDSHLHPLSIFYALFVCVCVCLRKWDKRETRTQKTWRTINYSKSTEHLGWAQTVLISNYGQYRQKKVWFYFQRYKYWLDSDCLHHPFPHLTYQYWGIDWSMYEKVMTITCKGSINSFIVITFYFYSWSQGLEPTDVCIWQKAGRQLYHDVIGWFYRN